MIPESILSQRAEIKRFSMGLNCYITIESDIPCLVTMNSEKRVVTDQSGPVGIISPVIFVNYYKDNKNIGDIKFEDRIIVTDIEGNNKSYQVIGVENPASQNNHWEITAEEIDLP
jgi:hypothetical protein